MAQARTPRSRREQEREIEVAVLRAGLLKAHEETRAARADAVALAAQLHQTRELLREVWEAGTADTVPFFERLPKLRVLLPRVAAALREREIR